MVQVPKAHVREAFVAAAAATFAELGFAATSMADVAERAQSSVGNLYKYFGSKRELFDAALPPVLAQELTRLTRARMLAFGRVKDVRELEPSAEYHAVAGDVLDYCLAHRSAVVVLLARAEGTAYADFAGNFVASLSQWALDYAGAAYPRLKPTPAFSFALRRAYQGFLASIAEALRTFPDDTDARAVIALLTAQHQGGLKGLFEKTEGDLDAHSHHARKSSVLSKAAGARARNARATDANSGPAGSRAGQADRSSRTRRRR